jgi:hypothetical protein
MADQHGRRQGERPYYFCHISAVALFVPPSDRTGGIDTTMLSLGVGGTTSGGTHAAAGGNVYILLTNHEQYVTGYRQPRWNNR